MRKANGSRAVAAALAIVVGGAVPRQASPVEVQGDASPLADDATLIALAVALSCADAPEVVAAPPAAPAGAPGRASARAPASGPELELVATVRVKALTFDEVPRVDAVFDGTGKRRTAWKAERVNLPARPEPGVTYRDVEVRLTVTSSVDELAALLNEAKRAARGIRVEQAQPAVPAAPSAAPAAPAGAPPGPPAAAAIAPAAPPAEE